MKDKNKQKYYDNNTEFQIESAAQSKQKQREWFKEIKEEKLEEQGGCDRCGYKGPIEHYDCHHKPGEIKIANVADLVGRKGMKMIREELDKTILLCNNKRPDVEKGCHEKTHTEGQSE